MKSFSPKINRRLALLAVLMSIATSPTAHAQSGQPIFQPSQNIASDTPRPSPPSTPEPPSEPLPVGWQITIGVAVILMVAALLYGSIKAWRFANLFDRQYRLPTPTSARLRLGGERCGGTMGQIRF